jgi:hypothetical protein
MALSTRNGYDGDVGIPGFIGATPPFVTTSASPQLSDIFGQLAVDVLAGSMPSVPSVGTGDPATTVPLMSPLSPPASIQTEVDSTNYFQPFAFVPAVAGDVLTVTMTNFDGYNLGWTVTFVVGPDENSGETYVFTGTGRDVSPQVWTIDLISSTRMSPTVIDFTVAGNNEPTGTTVQFTDISSPVPTSHLWNFGDGRTSTTASPTHVYKEPASYAVSMTIPAGGGAVVYDHWTGFAAVNSFDSVGIEGHIDEPTTFSANIAYPQTVSLLGYSADPALIGFAPYSYDTDIYVGAGTGTPPSAVPLADGETIGGSYPNNQKRAHFFFACAEGDLCWITQAQFTGPESSYDIVVVVGPDEFTGEQYTIHGTNMSSEPQQFRINRIADAGPRIVPETFITVTKIVTATGITSNDNTLYLPLKPLNDEQYSSIRQRGLNNQWPTVIFDNGGFPLRDLYFWPVPRSIQAVEVWLWEPLNVYAGLDVELNLPQGYERYLRFKLALELCAEFGKEPSPDLIHLATEAEANIKRLNQQTPVVVLSNSLVKRARKTTYIDFISSSDTLPEVQ